MRSCSGLGRLGDPLSGVCTKAAGSRSLLWLGEGLRDNLAVWYHPRPSQDWPQRQTSAKSCISLQSKWGFRDPTVRIGNTPLPVKSTKFLGLWWDSHLSFKKHISVLKVQCKEALNLIRVVAHLKWGGDRDTLLMLYQAIVHSKLDYGCIVYGTASNANLRQLDSIHNSGLRLAVGAFYTSPVSSLYTGTNEAPLEERRLKLSMHYYLKPPACINNPARHALHEFDGTTRDFYVPRPNGRGGMTGPPTHPIGLKWRQPWSLQRLMPNWSVPWGYPVFHQERTTTTRRDTTSSKEWTNAWSPDG